MSKLWHKIDVAKRLAFIRSCKGLKGAELTGAMEEFVSKEGPSTLTAFVELWMDSPDLKSEHKNNPEQWKALQEHTNKFLHLVTGFEAVEKGDMQKHVKAAKAVSSDKSKPKAKRGGKASKKK